MYTHTTPALLASKFTLVLMTNPSYLVHSCLIPRNAYASGYDRTDTTTVRTEIVAFFVPLYGTKHRYPLRSAYHLLNPIVIPVTFLHPPVFYRLAHLFT